MILTKQDIAVGEMSNLHHGGTDIYRQPFRWGRLRDAGIHYR